MMNRRVIIGSLLSMVAAIACGHATTSQAPSPIQSQVRAGSPSSGTISRLPDPGLGVGTMAGCPGGNGIHISATGGTAAGPSIASRTDSSSGVRRDSTSGLNQFVGLGQSIDTTWVFNIQQRTWTRTNLAAAISVGLADEVKGRYAICAGVNALIPNATLTLQGARGRVHFAASLKPLSDALRLGPGR